MIGRPDINNWDFSKWLRSFGNRRGMACKGTYQIKPPTHGGQRQGNERDFESK